MSTVTEQVHETPFTHTAVPRVLGSVRSKKEGIDAMGVEAMSQGTIRGWKCLRGLGSEAEGDR